MLPKVTIDLSPGSIQRSSAIDLKRRYRLKNTVFRGAGFTLVELLVVIAIIGILIGLLLPAINAARETGRRAQCSSNEKQIALALLAYHDSLGSFPPGVTLLDKGDLPWNCTDWGPNWVIRILPYMEENGLYDQFKLTEPISSSVNAIPRATSVKAMLCPSDTLYNGKPYNPVDRKQQEGENWARGNYASNGSINMLQGMNNDNDAIGPQSVYWRTPYLRGAMGINEASNIGQITDGTANTCLIGEVRAGVVPVDRRGTWAMGAAGASMLWGHGCSDDHGPNNPQELADDLIECSEIQAMAGEEAITYDWMGCDPGNTTRQATSRSRHLAGVNIAMCDGSVHFINNDVDISPTWTITYPDGPKEDDFHVWEKLMTAGDGYLIDGNAW
ncbi:MAG: DUF1559 domain-containing protein [Thermoguttaceae bacterium]